jgi:hypothetical protein
LHQLERTLGIRMERMVADDAPFARPERRADIDTEARSEASSRPRMVRLPGEVLQIQMES